MPVDHPDHPSSVAVIVPHRRKLSVLTGFIVCLAGLFLLGSWIDIGALLS